MKKGSLKPRFKSVKPPPEASAGPDREYPTLPMKAQIKSFGEMEFAQQVRAPFNGDYAIVDKKDVCGDGTGA
jgi:hypothetical protein